MGELLKKQSKEFTYGDYLKWPENERCELIEGVVYDMTPAPSRRHQEISMELSRQLATYLIDKPCRVYAAPFDVRLPEGDEKDEDIKTVVQPDITVVCDRSKLDDRGCKGVPDLIIEIVSPSSASTDYIRKLNLYEKHKLKEYWIVHPVDKIVMQYSMGSKGEYGKPKIYGVDDKTMVGFFDNLTIDLIRVFEE